MLDQRPAALMGPYCEKNQVKVLAYGTVHSHLDLSCLPAPTHALPHTHRGRQLSWGLRKILEFSPSENLRRCLSTEIKFESRSSCATRYVLTKGAPSYRLRGALPTVGRIVQALGAHNHHQHCHCHCQKPPCAPLSAIVLRHSRSPALASRPQSNSAAAGSVRCRWAEFIIKQLLS